MTREATTAEERESISRLRVTWVSHGYGYGGDLMYFGEIFRTLRGKFASMSVVVDKATRFSNPYGIALRPLMRLLRFRVTRAAPGGEIYETEFAVPWPWLLVRLLREPADALIAIEFTPPALLATLAAGFSRRKRLVLLVESDPVGRGASGSRLMRRIKRWAVSRADAIQTCTVKGRRYLIEDLRADPAKVRVAPYLTSRPPGPATMIVPEPGPLRILFANSVTPRKGLLRLLDAMELIEPHLRTGLALTVVGDGPEREEAQRRADGLGLAEPVRFAGRVAYADLGAFYARADVLAIPSLADYRSLAGFEGLAYGLALLASKHDGATEETVEEGVNGYALDPLDPAAFAQKIALLVADREQVLAMRRASLARYEERFSLDAIAGNIAESVKIASAG